MKRAGFTMIELIFVIVILGILSAVALPKFIGVSEQAEAGKCKAFYGTLSRTVGPATWSDMVLNEINATVAFDAASFNDQIDLPGGTDETCGAVVDIIAVAVSGTSFQVTLPAGSTTTYDVNGTAATTSSAPVWEWQKTP